MMTGQTSIDYTETYRTAYIQSLDGSQGFMIKTVTEDDNIFERYSKVRILLKGVTVEAESDPNATFSRKSPRRWSCPRCQARRPTFRRR